MRPDNERGGTPDVLFRAVPAPKLRNDHLGGFISVSSGFVPPARFSELSCELSCLPVAFVR